MWMMDVDDGQGPITLELYWDQAPKTCKNFWELAKRGYYDGVVFHRVIRVRRLSDRPFPPSIAHGATTSL